ncbi:MAG: hypothetical protein CBE15_01590 [Euryarchaeota archaeon TMED255]|nr:MAG: hypothetical protein CBE15_01590 [Euryarchaeota archaeon TMED255]
MNSAQLIPLTNLLIAFSPVAILVTILYIWGLNASQAIYANIRMLLQLLIVGYVLTFIFETDRFSIVLLVIVFMIGVSSWIAMRPLPDRGIKALSIIMAALGISGLAVLILVTQVVLNLPKGYEPSIVIPIAGMIFANSMNTISLVGERLHSELKQDPNFPRARAISLETAMIPQINALLAVGLVSLPGMMTGQILAGVEPIIAAGYQIVVMCMIFSSAGLSAAIYLAMKKA